MENRDMLKKFVLSELSKGDSALETAYLLNKHANQEKVKVESKKELAGSSNS